MAAQLFITVLTMTAFAPTFGNLLMTGWDDQWQVTNHFTSGGFTWNNLRSIFTEAYGTQYSPLNQCLYTLLYILGGYNPMLFHAASLLFHIANCSLVYHLLNTLLNDGTRLPQHQKAPISFFTTLLFAIHPLQAEAVAWISASKILLNTFFYLLATQAFIRFLHDNKPRHYALTLLFFVCSYGCKEQALIFPVWATWLFLFYGHKPWSPFVLKSLVPFYFISLLFGLIFIYGISSAQNADSLPAYTITQRLVFCCYSLVEYITKWYVPCNLLYLYPFPMHPGEALPVWLLTYPLILTIAVLTLWSKFRYRAVVAGSSFFLIHLLPVLHIIPIGRSAIVADRYIYLASVGLSFIAVYYLVNYYQKQAASIRQYILPVVALIFFALGTYTFLRTQVWHDTESLRRKMKELKTTTKITSLKKKTTSIEAYFIN
ncbi:MAG: hypothetical protein K2N13_04030 [Paraprevotella sp.]|nr:hypothetical protein [Paraprevotella sp.]